jgi:hypothetical protein
MVLKPLNNDEIEVDGSNQYGFYGPFYHGGFILLCHYELYVPYL